jgi:predicted Zn-dependent peptidase
MALGVATLTFGSASLRGQDLASFEKRITVKVLPNGLTLILCQRPEAPVFSFYTLVDAGSVDDPQGASGIAHMFEHMAFKGTPEIGTTNYPAEKAALATVETAYAAYDAEDRNPRGANPTKLAALKKAFDDAVDVAQKYVIPNLFDEIVEQNGAVGVNASTGEDSTQYFWSMPSNRVELWAYLESARIAHPVLREFYKERDVVQEERRMRTDSDSRGRLDEEFLAAAYIAHPYGRLPIGFASELQHISATEAEAFHHKYYVGSNIVVAVVGDIHPETDLPLIEKYFLKVPAGPKPLKMTTVEPAQHGERSVLIRDQAQPVYTEGYHRPNTLSPDDNVYDAIASVLASGRTGRLYKSLVRDQGIAAVAGADSDFPATKYPLLFVLEASPVPGHTDDEVRDAIHKELERLKTEDVTDAELTAYKTQFRAGVLRGLADNAGLAQTLAEYQTRYGDWRFLFNQLQKADAVTKGDIRRVANTLFLESNRTSARIETIPAPSGVPQ